MIQVTVVQSPAPTAAPAPPAPGVPGVTIVTPRALSGAPTTAQDVAALQARRQVLSDQLVSATSRRKEVSRQLRTATGADRTGLEQRIGVLDARIARLESDIDQTGQLLSAAPTALIAETQGRTSFGWGPGSNNRLSDNAVPIIIVFTIFVLFPLAMSISRMLWKRASLPRPVVSADTTQRLERMEQAMEAIAIEIERVSEGQRFVTRLMSEGKAPIPIPAKEPAHLGQSQRTPV